MLAMMAAMVVSLIGLSQARAARLSSSAVAHQSSHSQRSQIKHFRLPAGVYTASEEDLVVGTDGNVWFTYGKDYGLKRSGGVGRMTPTGHVTLFPVKLGSGEVADMASIIQGPDGALWFTLGRFAPAPVGRKAKGFGGAIGRITTSGAMTLFSLPTPLLSLGYVPCNGTYPPGQPHCEAWETSFPRGLTVGQEGDIWVAGGLDSIWRLSPVGEITTFQTPTPSSWPTGITSSPSGELWFSETNTNTYLYPPGTVGRITAAGGITELPPIAQAKVVGHRLSGSIAFADGAAWVGGEGFIAKVSSSGRTTKYPLGGVSQVWFGGAKDSKGNLWFVSSGYETHLVRRIVKITRTGRLSMVGPLLPALGFSASIAVAPNKAVWLTNPGAGYIIRVSVEA
jgi:virginiamycin B lyase